MNDKPEQQDMKATGSLGGRERAMRLSAARRREIGRAAAASRWANKPPSKREQEVRAAVLAEREACARVAEQVIDPVDSDMTALSSEAAKLIAALIRARS